MLNQNLFQAKRIEFPDGLVGREETKVFKSVHRFNAFEKQLGDTINGLKLNKVKSVLKSMVKSGLVSFTKSDERKRNLFKLIESKVEKINSEIERVFNIDSSDYLGLAINDGELGMGVGCHFGYYHVDIIDAFENKSRYSELFIRYLELMSALTYRNGVSQIPSFGYMDIEDLADELLKDIDLFFDGKKGLEELKQNLEDEYSYLVSSLMIDVDWDSIIEGKIDDDTLFQIYDATIKVKSEVLNRDNGINVEDGGYIEYAIIKEFERGNKANHKEIKSIEAIKKLIDFILFGGYKDLFNASEVDQDGQFELIEHIFAGFVIIQSEYSRNLINDQYNQMMQTGEYSGFVLKIDDSTIHNIELLKTLEERLLEVCISTDLAISEE